MRARVFTWVGGLILGAAVLVGWTAPAQAPAAGDCQSVCYVAKSRAYQACRQIAPSDREGRERCFREADAALARCLRGCK